MSLEEQVSRLADAIEKNNELRLNEVMRKSIAPLNAQTVEYVEEEPTPEPEETPEPKTKKKRKSRKKKEEKPAEDNVDDPLEETQEEYTNKDIVDIVQQYAVKVNSREKIIKHLSDFGAEKISDLDPSQYTEFHNKTLELINE